MNRMEYYWTVRQQYVITSIADIFSTLVVYYCHGGFATGSVQTKMRVTGTMLILYIHYYQLSGVDREFGSKEGSCLFQLCFSREGIDYWMG